MIFDVFYGLLALLNFPRLLYRYLALKKYRRIIRTRWGNVPERPAGRTRVWLHAVSVGEAMAAQPLLAELARCRPEVEVVISTITETGQAVAARLFGAERVFYCPFDFSWTVRRTFARVRPSLLVLMELELWPNLLAEARRRGVPVLVANGRITPRSCRRMRCSRFMAGALIRPVSFWAIQTPEYVRLFSALGVSLERMAVTGNLKYDALPTDEPPAEAAAAAARVRESLGLAPEALVLVGGSTHRGEERALLAAHRELVRELPAARLVLVPRHPERTAEVEAEIAAAGLTPLRKTALAGPGGVGAREAGDRLGAVLLVDTVGELREVYRAATAVFVGGSLIPHGGQNILEPAALGLPILHGPHMANFPAEAASLAAAGAAVRVADAAGLARGLGRLFRDAPLRARMGARAREVVLRHQGAARKTTDLIERLLAAKPSTPGEKLLDTPRPAAENT